MDMKSLKEYILDLETQLLKSEVRKSSHKIQELLCDDFIEYTSSGCEYKYKKGDIFQRSDDNTELNWKIKDFTIEYLSENCILARYKVIKHDKSEQYSLRSSIWKYNNGKWKMFFHQGTVINKRANKN